jgi:serine/threonine protein phosphatase PrpC
MVICCPDIHELEVRKEDEFIIMGSDGIWEKY